MASVSDSANNSFEGKEIPLATNVKAFPRKNNQIHAPEPYLDAEKVKIWKSQILIPYSVSGNVYTFLRPYPDTTLDPKRSRKIPQLRKT